MIFLAATAIGGGLLTAILLAPFSYLAVLVTAPLVASALTILAGLLVAWRSASLEVTRSSLDEQSDRMVAALRTVAIRAETTSPEKASTDFDRAA
jgi:hypothetical protein